MTNKEIGELRRRMKPDRTNLTAVYGCYVHVPGAVRPDDGGGQGKISGDLPPRAVRHAG